MTFHHGDSGEVLETLVDKWKEPVMFFLDAHWSGGEPAMTEDAETPLLREMRALSRRKEQADIIFIDDARFLGKSFGGTPGCNERPYITMDTLLKAYGRECRIINCTDIQDRVIIVPRVSTTGRIQNLSTLLLVTNYPPCHQEVAGATVIVIIVTVTNTNKHGQQDDELDASETRRRV